MRAGESFDTVIRAVKACDPADYSVICVEQKDRRLISVLLDDVAAQELFDSVECCMEGQTDWRIVILDVKASAPAKSAEEEATQAEQKATREEIYAEVGRSAALGADFIVLTILSTIVAAIGLNTNSVASVIGAMVIAPLLGPILAFTFGASLGDDKMLRRTGLSLCVGILLSFSVAFLIAFIIQVNPESEELVSRAEVSLDAVALAMAAGAAAALSLAKGNSSILVGVMVAAALLPPIAAVGLYMGSGHWELAMRAALLLTLNLASLVLSGLIVFWVKGIRPRKWIEQANARRAILLHAGVSAAFLILALFLILYLGLDEKITFPG